MWGIDKHKIVSHLKISCKWDSCKSASTQGKTSWLAPADTNSCRSKGAASPEDKAIEHQAVEVSMANMRVNVISFN